VKGAALLPPEENGMPYILPSTIGQVTCIMFLPNLYFIQT
jgi:hypothetical protein